MCFAHSCACGGRVRQLHCTPQCASRGEFYDIGKYELSYIMKKTRF